MPTNRFLLFLSGSGPSRCQSSSGDADLVAKPWKAALSKEAVDYKTYNRFGLVPDRRMFTLVV